MKIDRTKLYRLYMEKVGNIADTCEWKTFLTPDEVVNILSDVIEETPDLIDHSDECPHCGRQLLCTIHGYEPCYCWRDE